MQIVSGDTIKAPVFNTATVAANSLTSQSASAFITINSAAAGTGATSTNTLFSDSAVGTSGTSDADNIITSVLGVASLQP